MKSTLLLKNIGDATTEITLQVSYHVNFNETTKIKVQEFSIPIKTNHESEKTIEFDDLANKDLDVLILVQKPKGNIIAQKSFILNEIIGKRQIIEFAAKDEIELSDSDAIRNPPFVYGRLLDKKGEKNFEDVQIIIYVKKEGENDFSPLTSVKTEVQGYFTFEYPVDFFTEAVASIGLELTENPMPIKLVSQIIKVKNERGEEEEKSVLVFPRRVILVVVTNENLAEKVEPIDCGCHASEFGEKKVLEEFSFFSLIRTSQPEIMGYVLKDEDEITLWEILNNLPSSVFDMLEPIKAIPFISRVSPIKSNTLKSVSRTGTTRAVNAKATTDDSDINETLRAVKINKNVLTNFIRDEKTITKDNISKLFALNDIHRLQNALISKPASTKPLGRVELGSINSVDWDDEPTIYQAVSIAHGHLLQFKSEWLADGYSLGDLLYSLPLAPGQKKQIVVFDWERRESAANEQSVDYEESLNNSLTRDRDISEIAAGVLQENMKGGSTSKVRSISGGISVPVGAALIGVSGGGSNASTNAWQNNLRQTSSSDQQKLRDRIVQSANAVRNMRSTVIQTVSQGERFEISSESVANYNHCHAMTIQYYEVLRHFKIRQRFAEAKEVLFVPLLMTQFTKEKLLRWRESLSEVLIDRRLLKGFDAADRVEHQWKDSGFPSGTFASQNIVTASGILKIQFVIQRPRDKSDEEGKLILDSSSWGYFNMLFGSNFAEEFYKDYLENQERKDEIFHNELGEQIARKFIANLGFQVLDESQNSIKDVSIDASLTSRYYKDGVLNVKLNWNEDLLQRDKIYYLKIYSKIGRNTVFDTFIPRPQLPQGSFITVVSGAMNYRTSFSNGTLFKFQNIGDDLSSFDGVTIYTGPSTEELKDPRKEDVNIVNKLIAHLNDNLEYYHRAIWLNMSPERRFMLLDGIVLNGKGEGRSVASLVENELLTVVGNSLVFPVASGLNLNPDFGQKESLTEYYMTAAAEPISISVPTKGVFAEAVMGKCNSCEKIDESRFWRWEESPIPDSPTAINPINTDSRRADPGNLQPQQMPNPIVNIQNAPNAPDPSGLAGTLGLLGQSNLFKDITGIEGTQRNTIQGLQSTLDTAKVFAQESAKLETQKMMERRLDKAMNAIDSDDSLSPEKKAELKEKALNAYMGGGATSEEIKKDTKVEEFKERVKTIADLINDKTISPEQGKVMKENELKKYSENIENKPITSLEGIKETSNTASKDHTDIEVTKDGIKINSSKTTVAGSSNKLPTTIQRQITLARKKLSTGLGGVNHSETINEGSILLFDFDVNDSELKSEHIVILKDLADRMREQNEFLIAIEGHSSQTGEESANIKLSEDRVQSVHDYLVFNQAINQSQIIDYYGLGSTDPIINKRKIEESMNRSVLIRYSMPFSNVIVPANQSGSTSWKLRIGLTTGGSLGPLGLKVLTLQIESTDNNYHGKGDFVLGSIGYGGFSAGAEFGADLPNWVEFKTPQPQIIEDFSLTYCKIESVGLQVFFGYSLSELDFPNLGVYNVDIGGWNVGVAANVGWDTLYGTLKIYSKK